MLTHFRLYSSMITREIRGASSRPVVIVFERCRMLTRNKGRPKTYLAEDILIYLHEIGYKWNDIAAMFMVSRWTLFWRVKELGLESITRFSNISDEELVKFQWRASELVRDFKDSHRPAVRRSLVMGYLTQFGLRIQQEWIVKAPVRVDSGNSWLRWTALIKMACWGTP